METSWTKIHPDWKAYVRHRYAHLEPIAQGYEAQVFGFDGWVLKKSRHGFPIDVQEQYEFLISAKRLGLPVLVSLKGALVPLRWRAKRYNVARLT